MTVVLKQRSASVEEAGASPHVAVNTVAGMVLGILCLFAIVLAYQFLPRKKKLTTRGHITKLGPTPRGTPSLIRRIYTNCVTFFRKHRVQPCPSRTSDPKSPSKHRTLRSLHLPSERHRESNRERMRQEFATTHRLNLNLQLPPHLRDPFSALPRSPTKLYTRLDDQDSKSSLIQHPSPAVISPWSPCQHEYPSTSTPKTVRFRRNSDDPIAPPPPAYVPETLLRSARIGSSFSQKSPTVNSPTMKHLMEQVETVIAYQYQLDDEESERQTPKEGVFVITDESDWDTDSRSSMYSDPSL